jgi:hypothetical protein
MALVLDDIAEIALGPWGIAVGAGVAAVVLGRRALRGSLAGAAAGVPHRAVGAIASVGEWWDDIYAEAKSEWEASRSSATRPVVETPTVVNTARQRGPNGRFVRVAGA